MLFFEGFSTLYDIDFDLFQSFSLKPKPVEQYEKIWQNIFKSYP
jgi:hypothetical protein